MPRKKLRKIQEVDSLPNVFHPESGKSMAEMFDYLPPGQPLTLEIGCGRGDYTIKLAQSHPERNFVGVDLKGARLWTAARWAEREALPNVAFLRAPAQALRLLVPPASVEEIWLPFPDPFRKKRNSKWRVTSPSFLDAYRKVLRPGGRIHLKTDDPPFYEYSLEMVRQVHLPVYQRSDNIYADGLKGPVTEIQTHYEERHLAEGKQIRYLCFGFDAGDAQDNCF